MATADAGSRTQPAPVLLVWAVVGVQVLLILQLWVMGLGWGGVLYAASVLQGLVLLVVAVLLAVRRRLLVVLVPVVSVVLSLVLQGADALLTARACSPGAKAAVAELGLPSLVDDDDPSSYELAFPSGCSMLFAPGRPDAVVLEDLREAARRTGWAFTGEQRSDRVEISDGRWTIELEPHQDEDGPAELVVRPRRR